MGRIGTQPTNPLRRIVTAINTSDGQAVSWCDGSLAPAPESDGLFQQVRWTALMQIPYEVMPNLFVRPSLDSAVGVTVAMLAVSADMHIVEPMPDEVRLMLKQGVVADV